MKCRVLFAFLMPLCAGCESVDPCENTVLQTLTSPDKRRKVIVFSRGCGATTGQYTQVSVVGADSIFDEGSAGNVLKMDNDEAISLRWLNPTTIQIKIPATAAKNASRKSFVDGVSVVYK